MGFTFQLKNYHPKPFWGDDSSDGEIWGDNSLGGEIWGDDSSSEY